MSNNIRTYNSTVTSECFNCNHHKYTGSLINNEEQDIFVCEECFLYHICRICYISSEDFLTCCCEECEYVTNPMIGCSECIIKCINCDNNYSKKCVEWSEIDRCIKCPSCNFSNSLV